jgi:hypothetical protein
MAATWYHHGIEDSFKAAILDNSNIQYFTSQAQQKYVSSSCSKLARPTADATVSAVLLEQMNNDRLL